MYYLATKIMDTISDFSLFMKGFRRVRARALSAWIRVGVEDAEPIVFVHGVGMGLSTYSPFLHSLASSVATDCGGQTHDSSLLVLRRRRGLWCCWS